jgi:CNT family concentrative nucleoside transporter
MAAPGAIVVAKILMPQTEKIDSNIEVSKDKAGSNLLDAMATGTTEGMKLAMNIGAMLLVFFAFIALVNHILGVYGHFTSVYHWLAVVVIATVLSIYKKSEWKPVKTFFLTILGLLFLVVLYRYLMVINVENYAFSNSINQWIADNTNYHKLSMEFILGYTFAPLMWLIGVAKEDATILGQLLGIKLIASEFVGYINLGEFKNVANAMHINYEKSVMIATYMLCGFANFASIGIQVGGIGQLAPNQRKRLSEFGMKALLGGMLASLLSANFAGMLVG